MIAIIMSMANYNTAIGKIPDSQNPNKISNEEVNTIAKKMIITEEQKEEFIVKFKSIEVTY